MLCFVLSLPLTDLRVLLALTLAPQALIKINQIAMGKPNNEWSNSKDARITDAGQIRQGVPVSQEVILDGLRS